MGLPLFKKGKVPVCRHLKSTQSSRFSLLYNGKCHISHTPIFFSGTDDPFSCRGCKCQGFRGLKKLKRDHLPTSLLTYGAALARDAANGTAHVS